LTLIFALRRARRSGELQMICNRLQQNWFE
jgi:hypothetical protein